MGPPPFEREAKTPLCIFFTRICKEHFQNKKTTLSSWDRRTDFSCKILRVCVCAYRERAVAEEAERE